jgi:hypothetical protein
MTLSMLLALTAMMCKEPGITVLGVSAVYEVFISQKVSLISKPWLPRPTRGLIPSICTCCLQLRLRDFFHVVQTALRGKGALPPWLSTVTSRLSALILTLLVLVLGRLSINGSQLPVFTR